MADHEPHPAVTVGRRSILRRVVRHRASYVGLAILAGYLFLATVGPLLVSADPLQGEITERLAPPSAAHWLGTDELGRDVWSRLVYGARVSLQIQVVGVLVAMVPGVLWGLVSGYVGGWVDAVSMRLLDILLAFPSILLAIAIVAVLGPSFGNVIIAVGISSIPRFARLVRGVVLELRERDFVLAARAVGERPAAIIWRYLAPGTITAVTVEATIRMATLLLVAAGLNFLGLGVRPPTPEWGAMLANARDYMFVAPHVTIAPGLAITIVVIGFNLVGDALRDAVDPRT
jgi:peptide/nickel transport system permease protein